MATRYEERTRRPVTTRERLARHEPVEPSFSVPSLLAVVCAVASFAAGPGFGLFLALAAIVLGLVGAGLAMRRRVRGGVVSVISIVAGVIGIVAAGFKLLMLLF